MIVTRRAVFTWLDGHTHEETVRCKSFSQTDIPRLVRLGYRPHYVFFIFTHMSGRPHYRQARDCPLSPQGENPKKQKPKGNRKP